VWFTASALGLCLLMIGGLVAVILTNGLGFFWPRPLVAVTLKDGSKRLAEIAAHEGIPNPGHPDHMLKKRTLLKVGNRDLLGIDFEWVNDDDIVSREQPKDAWFIERGEYGAFLGTPVRLAEGGADRASGAEAVAAALPARLATAAADRDAIHAIERGEFGEINRRIERARLSLKSLDAKKSGGDSTADRARIEAGVEADQKRFAVLQDELSKRVEKAAATVLVVATASGEEKELKLLDVYRAYPANQLSWFGRARIYAGRLIGFLWDEPREANTEGGIFPAIFGTVMMVFLMTFVVTPFGRAGGALPARIRQAGRACPHRAHRGQQPRRRALDRLRRLRSRLLRLHGGRQHRPRFFPRRCRRRPTAPAASSGRRSLWRCSPCPW
jgi:phosphate transport system permease protein